jgi:Domain of unknown function (DUF4331)
MVVHSEEKRTMILKSQAERAMNGSVASGKRKFGSFLGAWLMVGLGSWLQAADHLDAPALRAAGQGGRDINDVYAFQSPTNPNNTVLVATVNPFAGVVNPFGTVSPTTFDPAVEYQFRIDNNHDALADITYTTTFTAPNAGIQTFTTKRNGAEIAIGTTGNDVSLVSGGMVHASLFDDPFFFDLVGFNNGFNFTGTDTFAGARVSAIVLEVPSTELRNGGDTNIGVWASTLVGGVQIDRKGRPAINTAVIPSGRKDEFNQSTPEQDFARFGADVQSSILSLNGGDAGHAATVAGILLPDILTLDTANPGGFLNGRGLSDDVIDAELNLLTRGGLMSDGVNMNDVPFRTSFPYLAVPEPSGMVLVIVGLVLCFRVRNGR